MRRLLALALLVCAGCASSGQETLAEDGWLGDIRAALFGESSDSIRMPTLPDQTSTPSAREGATP
jgi:hypothetical protein